MSEELLRNRLYNRHIINIGLKINQSPEEAELQSLWFPRLKEVVQMFWDPEQSARLNDLVHEGAITLAAIKPNTHDSRLGVWDDDEGALALESVIPEELEVVFEVSVLMNNHDVEAFYGKELVEGLKDRIIESGENAGKSVWEVYSGIMTAGPTTFMLLYYSNAQLYDEGGNFIEGKNAVQIWRNRMGPTNNQIAREEFPESIRGKYAVATEKNLVHGSDGIVEDEEGNKNFSVEAMRENVAREFEWLRNHLTDRLIKKEVKAVIQDPE